MNNEKKQYVQVNMRFKEDRENFESLQKQFTEDHTQFQEEMERNHKRVDGLMKDCEKYRTKATCLENEKRNLQDEIEKLRVCCSKEQDEDTKVGKLLTRLQNSEIYLQEMKDSHERKLEECKERSKRWQDRLRTGGAPLGFRG